MKKRLLLLLAPTILLATTAFFAPRPDVQKDAQAFLDSYSRTYQKLYYESSEAEWKSNTMIVEGDTTNAWNTRMAGEKFAEFTGSVENINKTREFLKQKDKLQPIQVRQLELILYNAANNPQTVPALVKDRIKAETEQTEKLFGYDYKIDGKSVSTNDIDGILTDESDLAKRRAAWESSKEVGKVLKPGLVRLRDLRNQTVQNLGYSDYFSYQVSDYGMNTEEMMALNRQLVRDIWPLYRELHTWARHELAKKYNAPVPDLLPAHWVDNRWAQDWSNMVEVKGVDLDGELEKRGPDWLVKQAERFYISLGFQALPASFYEKSSLYPVPADAKYKKNNHASAWHVDLDKDVRSLMSVEANRDWYETTHHELGHIYYYMTYSNKDVPILLRGGANRAYHEAFGSLMGLAAMQKPFLEGLKLVPPGTKTDDTQMLLKEALNYVVFMPWCSGTMTEFEHDLYHNNLPEGQFNQRWWQYAAKYQGIAPPAARGEEYCDAASKTHINNDAAQYYDYALSFVLLFQFHDHISKKLLHQDPHNTNYFGSKNIGNFLQKTMYPGASKDWRILLKETTGSDLSAKPMLDYFNPLMGWLKEQNKGRKHTLPETI
jgi:peptidyl-dipeptidase A